MEKINIEIELNKEINDVIIPRDNGDHEILDLQDSKINNIESVLKYVRLNKRLKTLIL